MLARRHGFLPVQSVPQWCAADKIARAACVEQAFAKATAGYGASVSIRPLTARHGNLTPPHCIFSFSLLNLLVFRADSAARILAAQFSERCRLFRHFPESASEGVNLPDRASFDWHRFAINHRFAETTPPDIENLSEYSQSLCRPASSQLARNSIITPCHVPGVNHATPLLLSSALIASMTFALYCVV